MPKRISILVEVEGITKEVIAKLATKIARCNFDAIISHTGVRVIEGSTKKYSVEEMLKMTDPYRGTGVGVFQEDAIYIFCQYDDEEREGIELEIQKEEELKQKGELTVSESYSTKEGVVSNLERHPLYGKLCAPIKYFKGLPVALELEQKLQGEYFPIPVRDEIQQHITFTHAATGARVGWYNLRANILWLSDCAHNPISFPKIFEHILDKVFELRTFGKFKTPPLLIGADPEFEILTEDNQLLPANMFFRFEGKIGTDGHNETGELRPDPARSPLALVKNIKRLIRQLHNLSYIPTDAKICAGGGTRVTTGGHIHFGMKTIPNEAKDILYELVGKAILSHQTGPRNNSKELITKNGGDTIRKADAHEGWEWRQPPSWLTSESITTCVLVTTYCVVHALSEGHVVMVGTKKSSLRSLPLYAVYKEYIEDFINKFYPNTKAESNKTIQLEGINIMPAWNLKSLERTHNIKVLSINSMTQKFFTPIKYQLLTSNKEIVIEIEFGGYKMVSYGLSEEATNTFNKIASIYLLESENFHTFSDIVRYTNNEGIPVMRPTRGKKANEANIFIVLPYAWERSKNKKVLFKRIGKLIRDTVISLDT